MYLCKRVLTELGGTLVIKSEKGKGTVCSVELAVAMPVGIVAEERPRCQDPLVKAVDPLKYPQHHPSTVHIFAYAE